MGFQSWFAAMNLQMAYIQYHLKCQDFTVNGGDNKL